MADISFYSDTKKVPNYNSILKKISEKYKKDFKYNESLFNDKEQLLSRLYELKLKLSSSSDKIYLDIFVGNDFIGKNNLDKDINYSKFNNHFYKGAFGDLNIFQQEKVLFEYIYKIYKINNNILSEINSYIYYKGTSRFNNLNIIYENKVIDNLVLFIEDSEIIRYFLIDGGGMQKRILKDKIDEKGIELLNDEIRKIKNIVNNKYDLLESDLNLKFEINLDNILKFLIIKIEELNIQVDTTKIEDLFEDLSKKAFSEAKKSLNISLGILFFITLGNVLLAFLNTEFDIKNITRYIPMILLEIILFKFMFFFFDKYNTYSKISSIYDYYKGLVQADNIYTIDKKFTAEQNFTLREKTYLELTNLTNHLKGLVDKNQSNSKDIIDILKEVNNISPIFKNLNK